MDEEMMDDDMPNPNAIISKPDMSHKEPSMELKTIISILKIKVEEMDMLLEKVCKGIGNDKHGPETAIKKALSGKQE